MPAETESARRRSSWLFLVGVVVFLGSAGLFVFDLANGTDSARGVIANAAAAALIVGLLGLDIRSNPDSRVESRGEALRAALFSTGCISWLPVSLCSGRRCSVCRSHGSAGQPSRPGAP